MATERRAWVRDPIVLSLRTQDGDFARSRDVSPGGMFIYFPKPVRLGDLLSIDVTQADVKVRVRAIGEIVRLEPAWPMYGAALRFRHQRLVTRDSVD